MGQKSLDTVPLREEEHSWMIPAVWKWEEEEDDRGGGGGGASATNSLDGLS